MLIGVATIALASCGEPLKDDTLRATSQNSTEEVAPADRPSEPADPAGGTANGEASALVTHCEISGSISAEGLGPLRLGRLVEDLPSGCRAKRRTMQTEVHAGTALVPEEGIIGAVGPDGRLAKVIVESRRPRTIDGLSVGATVSDIRRAARRGGYHMCARVGPTGVDVWRRGSGVVLSTSASSRVLGELVTDRGAAFGRVPGESVIKRIVVARPPACVDQAAPTAWDKGAGAVEVVPLDGSSLMLKIRASGLPQAAYQIAVGPYPSEGIPAMSLTMRMRRGLREGDYLYPTEEGEMSLDVTASIRRFGPDGDAAVTLLRVDSGDGPVRTARFRVPRE